MINYNILHSASLQMNELYEGSPEPEGVPGVRTLRSLCIIEQLERCCSKWHCHTFANTEQVMTLIVSSMASRSKYSPKHLRSCHCHISTCAQ